jgi:transcriptional regulator with XRE-family HTH domain
MTIGTKVRILREMKGITRESMIEILNVSDNTLAKIERDEVKHTVERLEQIASALQISLIELLTFGENGAFSNHSISNEKGNYILGQGTIIASNEVHALKIENDALKIRNTDLLEQIKILNHMIELLKSSNTKA